jgi:hypothetical protein
MSLEGNISSNQATRIKEFIKAGSDMLEEISHRKEEIKDRNDALKDLAKTVGEDVQIDAKHLLLALNIAFKNNAEEEQEKASTVEEILAIAGII